MWKQYIVHNHVRQPVPSLFLLQTLHCAEDLETLDQLNPGNLARKVRILVSKDTAVLNGPTVSEMRDIFDYLVEMSFLVRITDSRRERYRLNTEPKMELLWFRMKQYAEFSAYQKPKYRAELIYGLSRSSEGYTLKELSKLIPMWSPVHQNVLESMATVKRAKLVEINTDVISRPYRLTPLGRKAALSQGLVSEHLQAVLNQKQVQQTTEAA